VDWWIINLSECHSTGWLTQMYRVIFLWGTLVITLSFISWTLDLTITIKHTLSIIPNFLLILLSQVLNRLVRNDCNRRLIPTPRRHWLVMLASSTWFSIVVLLLTITWSISIFWFSSLFFLKNCWIPNFFIRALVIELFLVPRLLYLGNILLLMRRSIVSI